MKRKLKIFFNEAKDMRTIDLADKASNWIERILWIMIGMAGFYWAILFIPDQFKLWSDNPTIITKTNVDLSDIVFPAITIVPPGSTKFAIAERLGNYIDPKNLPESASKLVNIYLKCLTIYKLATEITDDGTQTYLENDLFDEYSYNCLFPHKPSPHQRDGCKVSNYFFKI